MLHNVLFTVSAGDDSKTEDGDAGNLKVNTRHLIIRNGGQLGSDNAPEIGDKLGDGKSGNVTISAKESVEVSGTSETVTGTDGLLIPSSIASFTINDKDAGDLTIETKRFTVKDGASITATTDGEGRSGILTIIADEFMEVSGISSDGKGSRVRNATFGKGNSNDLIIDTKRLVVKDGGRIDSRTQPSSFSNQDTGNAGNIKITTDIFEAYNGGQVISSTSGTSKLNSRDAGEININATEKVILSGVDSSFEQRSEDLKQKLTKNFPTQTKEVIGILLAIRISEGAASGVVVKAKDDTTGSAGNITIETPFLTIEDGARLNAETVTGEGGNITLQLQDLLLMRRNGGITARAEGTGNGGNVNIDSGFVVAVPNENNDIIARAVRGNGGNIKIDTQGIFGFQVSKELTPRSDISASSDFGVDGVEEINAPDIDPSRGTVNLPDTPVNLNLAQGCQPSGLNSISRFTTTGTASIPANPSDIQNIYTLWEDLRSPTAQNTDSVDSTDSKSPDSSADIVIKEAQGWIKTPDGKVKLVVKSPTVTSYSSWQSPSACDE
ncbi:MAG: S-layer family protein [Nostocaceae cyanobacterium]|nr:S-layer family protein [Nostocaceae cyanobacterium]